MAFEALKAQLENRERLCWYCNHATGRLVPVLDVGLHTLKFYCLPCFLKSAKQYTADRKLTEIQDENGDMP